jgi:hypothetical protein
MSGKKATPPNGNGTVSEYIALDWYEGPLLEIARVDFADRDCAVQVCSLCTVHEIEQPPSERLRGTTSGKKPWTRTVIRLTRNDLQSMMDMLDGKPVKDYNDL